jgi:DNA-directed RNA polymerase subunit RPC12/RpoP
MEEIVQRNKFGICPRCGKRLHLLNSTYQLYAMSENAWISKELDKHVVSKGVCRDCGFKMDMKVTINGLVPVDFVGESTPTEVLKPNPIGEIGGNNDV